MCVAAFALACAPAARAQTTQNTRTAQSARRTQSARTAQGARTDGVRGVVVDENGSPVEGASVALNGAQGLADVKTDAGGRFDFGPVELRGFGLTVVAEGFARFDRSWKRGEWDGGALRIVLGPPPFSERVTVTASRTETRLGETAASVVVLGGEELEATAALTPDDALRQVPGFQLFRRTGSRAANPTAQGVSLRGVGASGASRAVVLYDGVPLNDPFGGWVYWTSVPREAIARVEVLRGGASSLYGSGALGGVVQFVARKPSTRELRLELSYGSQGTPDASLYAGARKGPWGFYASAQEFATGGYVLVDERVRGPVDTPAASRGASGELYAERARGRDLRLFARASYYGESRRNGTPLQFNRTHLRRFVAGGDFEPGGGRAGLFTLRAYASTQVLDQSFTSVAQDRRGESLTRLQRVPAQGTGLSLQWAGSVGSRNSLVSGFELTEVRGASDELAFVSGSPSSLVDAGGRARTYALYARDVITVTPRLFITPAARFDLWRNYDARQTTRPLRGATSVLSFADREESAFSPQLSALYKVGERLSLNATFARSFRAPTLNELYRSFRVGNVLTLADENLRAERLTSGEAGAVYEPARGAAVRANFFWADVTRALANVTLSATPALITRRRRNLGRTRTRGLELEAETRLASRWSLSAGYLFADARVASFPADTSLEGLRVPQVAQHQLTFQARYTNPALVTFGVQARASGAQFDDDQNLLRLGGYFTLDALASRRLARGVEAFVAAENLTGRRYEVGRTPVLTLGPPLFVRLGLRLRLGEGRRP
jgi:outer membrane receptor protein involved in Fe transport